MNRVLQGKRSTLLYTYNCELPSRLMAQPTYYIIIKSRKLEAFILLVANYYMYIEILDVEIFELIVEGGRFKSQLIQEYQRKCILHLKG